MADCNDAHFLPLCRQTQRGRDCTEESDERSSGTLSGAYPSDSVIGCAQGTVRKAGALAVKNFLVHKKNKKVELATRRKWKHYWVSLKGVTPEQNYVEMSKETWSIHTGLHPVLRIQLAQ